MWNGYYPNTWDFATQLLHQFMSEHNDTVMHLLSKHLLAIYYLSAIVLHRCVDYEVEKDIALDLKEITR